MSEFYIILQIIISFFGIVLSSIIAKCLYSKFKTRKKAYLKFLSTYEECMDSVLAYGDEALQIILKRREKFDKQILSINMFASKELSNFLFQLKNNLPNKIANDQSIWAISFTHIMKNWTHIDYNQCRENIAFYFSCNNYKKLIKNN